MSNKRLLRFFVFSFFVHLLILFLIVFLVEETPHIAKSSYGKGNKIVEVSIFRVNDKKLGVKKVNSSDAVKNSELKDLKKVDPKKEVASVINSLKLTKSIKSKTEDLDRSSLKTTYKVDTNKETNLISSDSLKEGQTFLYSKNLDSNSENFTNIAQPDYDRNPKPNYPLIARRRGYEGQVVVDVFVLRDGKVGDLKLSHTSGYEVLDKSAINTVKDWIFVPQKNNGEPVSSWVKIPIKFKLTDI